MKKKILSLLLCGAMAVTMMTGCGAGTESETSTEAAASAEESVADAGTSEAVETAEAETTEADDENYDTGDASLDNARNQDEIGEKELLVVSFGTSYNDSRRLTIGAIEDALEESFTDYSVRRGFTSQIIIDHVKSRDGEVIDNVGEALDRAVDNGVKTLVVQPTHLMNGLEYTDLVNELAEYADAFDKVTIGQPLLSSDEDFERVIEAITEATAEYDDGETAICFMGHGTEADSNEVYARMQEMLAEAGYANYYIGTVEATPSLDDVLTQVQAGSYTKVVLEPLMIVAGDHANNDMAGDEEGSWKTTFEAAGYDVTCILRGLGELEAIQELFVEHAQAAVDEAEMVPVYAESLNDGTYTVTVDSSSTMFNIVDCQLTVADGEMTAVMTMSGTGYLYLYMGTGEAAAAASEDEYINFVETADGTHTFTVPVSALDEKINCAAFSKKKGQWYDRTLVFRTDSLPADAYAEGAYDTVESLGLSDGSYEVAVTLEGGSGKASVESPAQLVIADGEATATIVFSSPNYDYMVVNGETYLPVNTEGNSTFEIPVSGFNYKMAVTADTVAMSTPHEIEYTLYFDAAAIAAK